ncbi:MAG: hypothetical protein ACOCXT_03610 [Candidatus Dojkabacteria bacterium]
MWGSILLLVPIVLSLGHFAGQEIRIGSKRILETIQSFAGGFSVAYVFLILIPEIVGRGLGSGSLSMSLALIGFTIFHVALRYATRRDKSDSKRHLVREVHIGILALYSFLVSFSLVQLLQQDIYYGLIMLLIILIHTTLLEINYVHLDTVKPISFKSPFIILATLLGGIIPLFNIIAIEVELAFFSLTAGAIMYIAVREEIPQESKGSPAWFISGVFLLIFLSTLIIG